MVKILFILFDANMVRAAFFWLVFPNFSSLTFQLSVYLCFRYACCKISIYALKIQSGNNILESLVCLYLLSLMMFALLSTTLYL